MSIAPQVEAILYLKGEPVSLSTITQYLKCSKEEAQQALIELMGEYAARSGALEVVETTTGYSLQLRSEYSNLLETIVPADLNTGTLRTLAAIALKGSILQTEVVQIRGSGAYQHIQELVELGFIRKKPQENGRSYWLEVTDKFHRYFEVDHISSLS